MLRGETLIKSEPATKLPCYKDGGGGEDHLEGDRRENRYFLLAG